MALTAEGVTKGIVFGFLGIVITLVVILSIEGRSNWNERMPKTDPVKIDLSEKLADGSSTNNPDSIFYLPAKYWTTFNKDYENNAKGFVFSIKYADIDFFVKNKIDQGMFIILNTKQVGRFRIESYAKEFENKSPYKIKKNLKIYKDKVNANIGVFKGYDGNDVFMEFKKNHHDIYYASTHRQISSSVVIEYVIDFSYTEDFYDFDKKITSYIKNLQTPPIVFDKFLKD